MKRDARNGRDGVLTVSYTHLDVYKRQSFPWSWSATGLSGRTKAPTTSTCPVSYTHLAEDVIYLPRTRELLMPSLEVVPMQLLSYYVALDRKSVV